MLGEMTKTYPSWVQELRDQWLALLEDTKRRFEPPDPTTATAILPYYDTSPAACARRMREYQAAVEPIIQELVKLEGYATPSWLLPANPVKA